MTHSNAHSTYTDHGESLVEAQRLVCPNCHKRLPITAIGKMEDVVCPYCQALVNRHQPGLQPGMVVDDFQLIRRIGRGAMGEVFLAQQRSLSRPVAIKALSPGITASPTQVAHFRREIQNLARLQHPNIVAAFYAGVHADVHYLAMSYVAGEDLHTRIQRSGPLREAEALSVCFKVGDALRYAWEAFGCIHQDIKPANIMIDDSGDIRLTDLGLSRFVYEEEVGNSRQVFGTPHYMGPEQVRGERDLDFRTDMYALGMTFYQMCCGHPPFESEDVDDILDCQRFEQPPPLATYAPHISNASVRILDRLIAKHAGDRFDSWDTMLLAVQSALDQWPPAILRPTPQPATRTVLTHPRRRPSHRTVSWALALLLVLVGIAWWVAGSYREPPTPDHSSHADRSWRALHDLPHAWSSATGSIHAGWQTARNRLQEWRRHHGKRQAQRERQQRIADVLEHLDTRARAYLLEGEVARAAAVYTEYDGPWADESFSARRERAAAFYSRPRSIHAD